MNSRIREWCFSALCVLGVIAGALALCWIAFYVIAYGRQALELQRALINAINNGTVSTLDANILNQLMSK